MAIEEYSLQYTNCQTQMRNSAMNSSVLLNFTKIRQQMWEVWIEIHLYP